MVDEEETVDVVDLVLQGNRHQAIRLQPLRAPLFVGVFDRHARVTVEYTDEKGRPQQLEADGLMAIALQHEIDHINGLLFIDHLSKLKRSIALRKSAKLKRKGE